MRGASRVAGSAAGRGDEVPPAGEGGSRPGPFRWPVDARPADSRRQACSSSPDSTPLSSRWRARRCSATSAACASSIPSTAAEPLTLDRLTRLVASRLPLVPPFRRRLVEVPLGLDMPYWIDDPDFDIEFHVRELALPAPGNDQQLREQAARLHARPLDRRAAAVGAVPDLRPVRRAHGDLHEGPPRGDRRRLGQRHPRCAARHLARRARAAVRRVAARGRAGQRRACSPAASLRSPASRSAPPGCRSSCCAQLPGSCAIDAAAAAADRSGCGRHALAPLAAGSEDPVQRADHPAPPVRVLRAVRSATSRKSRTRRG